jgi:hypothetical protein
MTSIGAPASTPSTDTGAKRISATSLQVVASDVPIESHRTAEGDPGIECALGLVATSCSAAGIEGPS